MIPLPPAIARALALASTSTRAAAAASSVPVSGGARAVVPSPAATQAVQARTFVEVRVRRESGAGFDVERLWNDVGAFTAEVQGEADGATETLTFAGAGGLLGVAPIPRTLDLSVRPLTLRLSPLAPEVLDILQGRASIRGGRVRIWRGVFEPGTRTLIGPALRQWVGVIDGFRVITPPEGGEGELELTTRSQRMAGLSRANFARRSDEDQRRRNPADAFFKDAATAGRLRIAWAGSDADVRRRSAAAGPSVDPADR